MATTKNDVLNAIEQLESNDQNPTNANILAITGGSNATIQKYRSEIMQERQQQAFKSRIVLKDSELSKLTTTFNDLLANRLGDLNSELSNIITQLENSNSELSHTLDKTRSDLESAEKTIVDKDSFIKELETKISFANEAFDIERKTILDEKESLNKQLFELAKEVGKVELLTAKLEQSEKENQELKRMIENAKAEETKKTTRKQEKLPLDRE
jgi:chromosome segregation ATPase